MTGQAMLGMALLVDDAAAAARSLVGLGLPEAPEVAARLGAAPGAAAVAAGGHFLALVPRGEAGPITDHTLYLGGDAPGLPASAGGVRLDRWAGPPPALPAAKDASVEAIDHMLVTVDSIGQAAAELRRFIPSKPHAVWTYPALKSRAVLHDLGPATWLELNEPLAAGEPTLFGERRGMLALILRTRDIEKLKAEKTEVNLSRLVPTDAQPPGSDAAKTLGLVTLVKNPAFGGLNVYVYQPQARGVGADPSDVVGG